MEQAGLARSTALSSSTCRAVKVPPERVREAWDKAREHIRRAVEGKTATGEVYLEDVYVRLLTGAADLWLIYAGDSVVAAFVTQVVVYERTPVLLVPYVGGDDLDGWDHLIEDVMAEARSKGCRQVELLARKGWARVFSHLNPREHWTMYRIDADQYQDAE